ncbi:hypothetical protein PG997_010446 [Apiospora hydei]|uniref:Uncharacterized protein n=1 Tax=Apiospora hydei TaxID=1337664 RepID=A0ABR1W0Z2_9PEZI
MVGTSHGDMATFTPKDLPGSSLTIILSKVVEVFVLPVFETAAAGVPQPEVKLVKVAFDIPLIFDLFVTGSSTGPTEVGPTGTMAIEDMLDQVKTVKEQIAEVTLDVRLLGTRRR